MTTSARNFQRGHDDRGDRAASRAEPEPELVEQREAYARIGKQDFQLALRNAPEHLEMQRVLGDVFQQLFARAPDMPLGLPLTHALLHEFRHACFARLELQGKKKPAVSVNLNRLFK